MLRTQLGVYPIIVYNLVFIRMRRMQPGVGVATPDYSRSASGGGRTRFRGYVTITRILRVYCLCA